MFNLYPSKYFLKKLSPVVVLDQENFLQSALLLATASKRKSPVWDKLHDYSFHVFIRQESDQLAGEDKVADGVMSRREIYEHGTGLSFCLKTVLSIFWVSTTAWSTVDLPHQNPACSSEIIESIMGSTLRGQTLKDLIDNA